MATKLSGLRVSLAAVALVLSIAQVPSAMAEIRRTTAGYRLR